MARNGKPLAETDFLPEFLTSDQKTLYIFFQRCYNKNMQKPKLLL